MEIFKKSKKSICHSCYNFNEICNIKTSKTCGTDQKVEAAFVQKCNSYNKEINKNEYKCNTVSVNHATDTRVEMMGGGH